jgi:molecular chaperone GrpE
MTRKKPEKPEKPERPEEPDRLQAPDEPETPGSGEPPPEAVAGAATGGGENGSEAEQLAAELGRQRELHLRARADLDNFRKRSARDRPLISAQVKRDLVAALLPAIDALDLAIRHADEDADLGGFLEGVRAARDSIESALAAQGVERIPAEGSYDPELHNAQAVVPTAEHPDGAILEELRAGYRVGKLVARHTEVVVAKNSAAGDRGAGNGDRESNGASEAEAGEG